jgi:hypothetical protein
VPTCKAKLERDQTAVRDDRERMLREVAAQSAFKEAEIAALREALQQDRTFFEAQKARIAAAMPPCNQRVKLNVGDVYFETSRAT